MSDKGPNRIQLIDALRGLSIILVLGYHCGFDLYFFELIPESTLYNPLLDTLQPIFAGVFILLAGISSRFSRDNLKRGLVMLACAAVVTGATYVMGLPVWIGILHLLAASTLSFWALEKLGATAVAIPFLAFLGFYFELGYWPAPAASADYFPFIPWMFLFFAGTYLGIPIKEGRFPRWFYEAKVPVLPAIGKRTLWIFMLHQPVIYGTVWLIARFLDSA